MFIMAQGSDYSTLVVTCVTVWNHNFLKGSIIIVGWRHFQYMCMYLHNRSSDSLAKNIGYFRNSVHNIPKFDLDLSKIPHTIIQNKQNKGG